MRWALVRSTQAIGVINEDPTIRKVIIVCPSCAPWSSLYPDAEMKRLLKRELKGFETRFLRVDHD